jgi:SAM-dependent methyltransferase
MSSNRIPAMIDAIRGPSVLDIGCTGGLQTDRPLVESPEWVHGQLHKAFDDVHGIDLSPEKIRFLHDAGYPDTTAADAQDFDLGRQFDTVVAGELIEHLENPGQFLRAATRHLKPGGRIVLTTPYAAGVANVLYAWLKYPKTCSNVEHTLWLCPSTMEVLAGRCGLRMVSWRMVADYPGWGEGRLYRWLHAVYPVVERLLPDRVKANGLLAVLEPV